MSEWQKIETAPKDGTKILCIFMKAKDPGLIGFTKVDSWQERYGGFGGFNKINWPATHWMPLPQPPELD